MACWRSPAAKGMTHTGQGIDVKIDGHEQYQITGVFHIDTARAVDVADAIDLAESWRSRWGIVRLLRSPPGEA